MTEALLPKLSRNVNEADRNAVLPKESITALRNSGLMGLLVPARYGGMGGSVSLMAAVASRLSSACLSTGFVWAMHCQQVAVLADHATEELAASVLPKVATKGWLIGSVTTEKDKGGDLFRALSPLVRDGNDLTFTRDAPTVTAGLHADGFLMTMRSPDSKQSNNVTLAYTELPAVSVSSTTDWDPMGMRGTESLGLSISGRIPKTHLIADSKYTKDIIVGTMIPTGVIGIVACWLGVTQNVFRESLSLLRDPKLNLHSKLKSDLFAERLARIRLSLDIVSAYLKSIVQEYESLRKTEALQDTKLVSAPPFQIHINNLKVMASEQLFDSINRLVDLMGMQYGYMRSSRVPLERVFRDLKSASLLISNDRLLQANGRLALFDTQVTLS